MLGAGTMGNDIAQACAVRGIKALMVDINEAAVQRGLATVAGSLDRLIKKEKISADKDAALTGAQLVIEAATENEALKLKILQQLDTLLAAGRHRCRHEAGLQSADRPTGLADMIGLDVCLAVTEVYVKAFTDATYRPAPLPKEMVAAGWLGRKTGRGVYRY